MNEDVKFGPSGETVFKRTYSRPKPNGEKESWRETVERVAAGNLALVHGDPESWDPEGPAMAELLMLTDHMYDFRVIPAGRHLWASGVKGRQFLMNCWTAGWTNRFSEHAEFTFMRLMEGGGVGSNYSSRFLAGYGAPQRRLDVHVVVDPDHPDADKLEEGEVLSEEYSHEWLGGAHEVEDSREGWADALVDLIDTFYADDVKHMQRVYDVTRVRPEGARLKTFGGTASGPLPFAAMMHRVAGILNTAHKRGELGPLDAMAIDHAIAECVVSGGVRRSARMSIVHWADPAIFEFIECKASGLSHWTTNISVQVDDEFFEALSQTGARLPNGRPASAHAKRVHQLVTQGMLSNGEPGYWNSSLSNHGEVEEVYATNPCGEITLQMFEACNLGHVNLDAFAPKRTSDPIDFGGLVVAHQLITRFLMRATYGDIVDPKSRKIQDQNRRIGVGHLGVQGFIVKNGWRYSQVASKVTAPGYREVREMLSEMYASVRNTARGYAFELRIPEPVKVTTVAPTGSVAKLPGVTEGIHPVLYRFFEQRIRFSNVDSDQAAQVEEARLAGFAVEIDSYDQSGNTSIVVYPTKNLLVEQVEALGYDASLVEQADEISVRDMLSFQAMYQEFWADNAVSFTVNVPAEKHQNDYLLANPGGTRIPAPTALRQKELAATLLEFLPVLKGTTVMLDGSRVQAPFTAITEKAYEAAAAAQVMDAIDVDCATGACPIR